MSDFMLNPADDVSVSPHFASTDVDPMNFLNPSFAELDQVLAPLQTYQSPFSSVPSSPSESGSVVDEHFAQPLRSPLPLQPIQPKASWNVIPKQPINYDLLLSKQQSEQKQQQQQQQRQQQMPTTEEQQQPTSPQIYQHPQHQQQQQQQQQQLQQQQRARQQQQQQQLQQRRIKQEQRHQTVRRATTHARKPTQPRSNSYAGRKRHSTAMSSGNGSQQNKNVHLTEQELKRQRLARKAELARLSRRRKKERLAELEEKVADLKAQLEAERNERQVERDLHAQQLQQLRMAASVEGVASVTTTATATATAASLNKTFDDMADGTASIADVMAAVRQQVRTPTQHVEALSATVRPALPVRFMQWMMTHSDQFYADPSSLWHSLFVKEMGMSAQQVQRLLALRTPLAMQFGHDESLVQQVNALKPRVVEAARKHAALVDQLEAVMSPEQLAKLMTWVHQFGGVCCNIHPTSP
eukprot:TRINITY_DN67179_c10_g8_i2.p1 TRINITY_DN67179_c10_g8~~TRINITY_DN67179_c10_g8_i2.p1  ORF type:complete len:469 (+),score=277.76 TRINITY_DN67179_c10_g8_i2:1406-2812(+)